MRIKVHIDCVDGEHFYTFGALKCMDILKFLEKYDHEGSNVSATIELEEGTEVYDFLQLNSQVENAPNTNTKDTGGTGK